jgi:hypothetical protein
LRNCRSRRSRKTSSSVNQVTSPLDDHGGCWPGYLANAGLGGDLGITRHT